MSRLPVIVGIGGVNPAGRVSGNHAYRRVVIDKLSSAKAASTYASLASLMELNLDPAAAATRAHIRDHTLVRRIESYDAANTPWQRSAYLSALAGQAIEFTIRKRDLPEQLPSDWDVIELDTQRLHIRIPKGADVLMKDTRKSRVSSAGQLPTGFRPDALYAARSHPRGLQLAIWGASDAIRSVGIDWETIRSAVRPDQIAVYASSAMGQLDFDGTGGALQSHLLGKRPTSKQVPLGLAEMPADFVNAYVLGNVGCTGSNVGACATFLYNLRLAVDDIRNGHRRVVIVGGAEAPILPEIIDAYCTMGALAEDEDLMALDGRSDAPDCRRAVRPFSDNCGFTVAEAGIYTVLFDDELALQLGANIHGAIADVFVNADGYKKSIPGPGVGNYLTMAKALATAEQIIGREGLRQRSFIQAHGTSTPQNRVTESHIMSLLAGVFGIPAWTVSATKAFVGHSMSPAAGDQLAMSLGVWQDGWIPGITTIDHLAGDVHTDNLNFPMQHTEVGVEGIDAAFLNSKGFGGNNATAILLAPHVTRRMLARKHGVAALTQHARLNDAVSSAAVAYDAQMTQAPMPPVYRFGEGVVEGDALEISRHEIRIPGFTQTVNLDLPHPYPDMQE